MLKSSLLMHKKMDDLQKSRAVEFYTAMEFRKPFSPVTVSKMLGISAVKAKILVEKMRDYTELIVKLDGWGQSKYRLKSHEEFYGDYIDDRWFLHDVPEE